MQRLAFIKVLLISRFRLRIGELACFELLTLLLLFGLANVEREDLSIQRQFL